MFVTVYSFESHVIINRRGGVRTGVAIAYKIYLEKETDTTSLGGRKQGPLPITFAH